MSKSIATKIAKITKELGPLKKDKTDKVNYDFHGYESLNQHLRPLLSANNLAIIPAIDDLKEDTYTVVKQWNGKADEKNFIRTIVKGHLLIICGDTGDELKVPFYGVDQDYGGKSFGQAVTEMVKRFELKLFHVSMKGDIDPDGQRHENAKPKDPFLVQIESYGLDKDIIAMVGNEFKCKSALSIPEDKRQEFLNRLHHIKVNGLGEEQ